MVSFTVRMRFDPRDHDEIRDILVHLSQASRLEPGCISYIPHFIDGDSNTVLIYEQYQDQAALDFHRSTPHFKKYAIGGLFQRMLDRQVESLLAVQA